MTYALFFMRPKCAEIAQHVRQTKKQDAKHIPGIDRFCPSALLHANKVGKTVGDTVRRKSPVRETWWEI